MIVVTRDAETFQAILASIAKVDNVRVEGWKPLNAKGTRFSLKLGVHSSRGQYGKRRNSYGPQGFRRVHALCWHGFRDAFRAAFQVDPQAIFRTALESWKGSQDFEARFQDSGFQNIGSQVAPLNWHQACACSDGGAFQD